MKPLHKPDPGQRSDLFKEMFGVELDSMRTLSPAELLRHALEMAQHFVHGLMHPDLPDAIPPAEDENPPVGPEEQ